MAVASEQAHRAERFPLHAELEIYNGRETRTGMVMDVSKDGMFVATDQRFHVGQSFPARLLLAKPLAVTCVVARIVPGRGVGLRYFVV